MTELKPCPFCGSKKVRMYSERDNSVHGFIHICEGFDEPMVKVESRLFSTEEEAIEAWNRRVEQESKTEQFAKWVATEIFDDMWEYNKDAFAELACRRLAKIGIVKANGDNWELTKVESEDEE